MRPFLRLMGIGVLILFLTAATGEAQDFPLARDDPTIRNAVGYLLSCQNEDGGFGNEPDASTSSLVPTANAAMALALTGDLNRAREGGKTPLDYLVANPPGDDASGGSIGRYVMGIVACGGNPRDVSGVDYVEWLKKFAKPPRGEENLFSESYILLGLAAAGESKSAEAKAFISYVLEKQHSSGGWGWGGGAPDLDTTGIATSALLAAGEDPESQMVKDAIAYIRTQQSDDSGFTSSGMSADSNAISDYWAIMALNGAGVDPTEWRKGSETPVSHLLSCQQESGVFWWKPDTQGGAGFLVEATAYGIIALMGERLPITAAMRGEVGEGATVTVTVLGDGYLLFSRDLAIGAESFNKDGFEVSNPTVLGTLAATGLTYTLADTDGSGSPAVSDLEGFGAPIYFVDGARQDDPIGEYNLTGDECVVISAPATVLPLVMIAPKDVVTGEEFAIEVASEDLDARGSIVKAPVEGATVTVTFKAVSTDYTTDKEGKTLEIALNEPGEYKVEAKKDGYISTFYLNCGYQVINCQSGEPVDVTIHVLGNGAPLFSGEVEVQTADFNKDGFVVDNPTAMGALELTGVPYSLSEWSWGLFISDVAGFGTPSFYANGGQAPVGLDQFHLRDGDCIVVSAPWSVSPLYMDAPTDVVVGEKFKIEVESEEYDANWNLVRKGLEGATVTVGTTAYITGADGYTPDITLNQAGEYEVRAEKPGYIGTYYLSCGSHVISCQNAALTEVTIHVLGGGSKLFSGEVTVSSAPFTKDGFEVDNPTAMGALELTKLTYSLSEWSWGLFVSDVDGYGSPSFYVDGGQAPVGLDQYYLNGGEWITVSAPWSVSPLYLDAPNDAAAGEAFDIKVETEEYDANWNLVMVPVVGATVTIEGDPGSPYSTNGAGIAKVTLHQTGEYKVKAEKAGYIGTYYMIPGGYHVITVTGESGALSVTKRADNDTAEPGDILTYYIKICNDDKAAMKKVNVTDFLQMDSEFVYADPWPNKTAGNELVWNLPEEIAPGECREISLKVKVSETTPSGYILENCANVLALNDTDVLISALDCEKVFIGISNPLVVTKTADKESVERGKKVKYTIKVCNLYKAQPLTDVAVEDVFSRDVKFVFADPAPLSNYGDGERFREIVWTYDSIEPNDCEEIILEVLVPEMQDFEFGMEQRVRGEGFVNVANDYSTAPPEYVLENVVLVSAKNSTNSLIEASASESVGVTDPGTKLSTREHGSGSYESEELVAVKTENKSIEMSKDVSATYATTALGLYNNRSVAYSSRWTESACAKNRIIGTSMSETYRYAASIDRDSRFKLDETSTSMAFESGFDGMGSFRIFQKPSSKDGPAEFESEETYSGSFKIYQVANGSSIKYEKTASGTGSVAADKRIGGEQRSYEAGSGAYESDEIIEAATNYIAKDISLSYQPTSFDLGGDRSFSSSNKWNEGIWSKNVSENSTTFIGEEFSSLDRLDKETFVRGLGDVATEAEFSGTGRFRAIYVNTHVNESDNESVNGSMKRLREAEIEIDDHYFGDYSIQRRVIFAGAYEYNEPHLSAEKSGEIFYEDDATLARYNITLKNDGNRALGPLVIRDIFPPGAEFVNASERVSRLSDESAEWTFLNLGLGGSLSFSLWLDVTDCRGDEIVNRIKASAGYNGNSTTAAAFSAIETDWLSWTEDASVTATKSGEVDENDPRVVTYTITVQNLDGSTKVATVADILPEGMRFLDSSLEPSSIDGNTVTWTLIDIGPYESEKIVYGVEALRSGRFFNRAVVDARSVDGSSTPPVYANSIVETSEGEVELPKPIWHPPDWDFVYMDYENNLTCEEVCNLKEPEGAVERGSDGEVADKVVFGSAKDGAEKAAGESVLGGPTDSSRFDELSENVDLAVSYILTCQNDDGGFAPKPGDESSLASTTLATIALDAAGKDPADQLKGEKSPADYLAENADELASSSNVEAQTGRYVVALVSAGLDPADVGGTDYVEILKGYSKPSGGIGKENYIWDDGWVILGLAAAGESGSEEVRRAAIYLKGHQTASGGWAWHGGAGGEDPDTTGLVVCALFAAGEDESSESIVKALDYFRSEQNDDGGLSSLGSNSATDGWVIIALNGAGQDLEDWRRGSHYPLDHLSSLQKENGSIWWKEESEGSSFEWTAQGIVAMSGGRLPPQSPEK